MDTKQSKRFITMKNYKGIRKDTRTNKFVVTKSINGKRCYETFNSIREAAAWKNSFNPGLKIDIKNTPKVNDSLNGNFPERTFNEVWELHFTQHVAGLELSSRETYTYLISLFDQEKLTPINRFTPAYIDRILNQLKETAIGSGSKRSNFDRPLKLLKSMFRWYKENHDHTFISPILKRHFVVGKIKDAKKREMKLTDQDIVKFFSHLSDFYRDFAMIHFYIAGRVQEVAGIQVTSVDLKEKSLLIKDVVIWGRHDKKFAELKSHTKNGEIRYAHLTDILCNIFKRRLQSIPKGCTYVFHNEGRPLTYRQIQFAYNKALKDAKLTQFSSTHILRHSMATITRRVTGSLEATQAVTGHKDQKLVQHYASLPELAQIDAIEKVEKHFENLKSKADRANKCEQK